MLRDYLLKGYALNQRMNRIENNVENLSNEMSKFSLQLKTRELPNHGVFFNGQVYDAYVLVAKLIKKAKNRNHLNRQLYRRECTHLIEQTQQKCKRHHLH